MWHITFNWLRCIVSHNAVYHPLGRPGGRNKRPWMTWGTGFANVSGFRPYKSITIYKYITNVLVLDMLCIYTQVYLFYDCFGDWPDSVWPDLLITQAFVHWIWQYGVLLFNLTLYAFTCTFVTTASMARMCEARNAITLVSQLFFVKRPTNTGLPQNYFFYYCYLSSSKLNAFTITTFFDWLMFYRGKGSRPRWSCCWEGSQGSGGQVWVQKPGGENCRQNTPAVKKAPQESGRYRAYSKITIYSLTL